MAYSDNVGASVVELEVNKVVDEYYKKIIGITIDLVINHLITLIINLLSLLSALANGTELYNKIESTITECCSNLKDYMSSEYSDVDQNECMLNTMHRIVNRFKEQCDIDERRIDYARFLRIYMNIFSNDSDVYSYLQTELRSHYLIIINAIQQNSNRYELIEEMCTEFKSCIMTRELDKEKRSIMKMMGCKLDEYEDRWRQYDSELEKEFTENWIV